MSDFEIREYRPEDIPQLSALWQETFGDSEHFVSEFFRMLPDMGTGLAAVSGDSVMGAAYVLTGQELVLNRLEHFTDEDCAPVIGYIYAVSVFPDFRNRGIGSALVKAAAEEAGKREADIVCTLPASESLYKWYGELIGVNCVLRRSSEIIGSAPLEMYMPLSSAEYMLRRENMLSGRPHLHLSAPSLEFERILCAESGGGFYAAGCGIAAAYKENGRGVITELICADENQRERAAASIGDALGVSEVELLSPSSGGSAYIAADSDKIVPDTVWNLSFD